MLKLKNKKIPVNFNYEQVLGLKKETYQKLKQAQPKTIEEASQIAGINPVDINILILNLQSLTSLS